MATIETAENQKEGRQQVNTITLKGGQRFVELNEEGKTTLVPLPLQSDTIMRPGLVDALFDEMGVGEEGTEEALEIRAATKVFCIKTIEGWNKTITDPKHDGYTVGEINSLAWAFVEGYEAALKRAVGLPQP